MKSFKMKALALATLGLGGLVMAGSAFAACPAGATTANGGAWDSQSATFGTIAVVGGTAGQGLDGTSCKLSVNINAGAQVNAKAFVSNTTGPSNEQRYRARFYIETTGLTGLTVANRQAYIFTAQATTAPTGLSLSQVNGFIVGGATPSFAFLVGDTSQPTGYSQITVPFPDASGEYRVEFDLTTGNPGSFRCWVTAAGTATTDASPTPAACAATSVSNSGWGGISRFNFGFANVSQQFRANLVGQILCLDEFDSRRQTFIGQ